ncbi:MAG: GNAT family protein [Dehalococcoidia bacterium]|nr:GNAT family protein [Dehalococcoidia bacterium]
MKEVSSITGQLVSLRPTTAEDLDFVINTEQAEDNPAYVNVWSREQHRQFIDDSDTSHLIVDAVNDARRVGYVLIARRPDSNHSIELMRITIAEKGRGFGRDALRLVKTLAFDQLGAHRLWLDVRDHNLRAQRLYESEGFVREGVLRDYNRVGDRYESLIIMSILEHEYLA